METLLIVAVLLAVVVGVTIWARRRGRRATTPDQEQDTAWNDRLDPQDGPRR